MRGLLTLTLLCTLGCHGADKGQDVEDTDNEVTDTDATDTEVTDTDVADTDVADTDATVPLIDTEVYSGNIGISVTSPYTTCDPEIEAAILGIETWSIRQSCSFASMGVAHSNDEVALFANLQLDDTMAVETGDLFQVTWDPEAGVSANETPGSLRLVTGQYVTAFLCNDAILETPVEEAVWIPIDGFMVLEATEGSEGTPSPEAPFTGEVRLSGVVLEKQDDSGQQCALPDITVSSLSLGWLPG